MRTIHTVSIGLILIIIFLFSGCTKLENERNTVNEVSAFSENEQNDDVNNSNKGGQNKQKNSNDTNRKIISITFDDGPDPTNTPKLLEILKNEGVPATFFLIGQNVDKYPDVVKSIFDHGHEIGNHTYDHKDLKTLGVDKIKREIDKTDQSRRNIIGENPKYFRPPYGSVNLAVAKLINRPIIQWSVDSEDWKTKNGKKIIDKVTSTVYDGSIILLHDIHKETIEALPNLISRLKKDGYQFVSLKTLLNNPKVNDNFYGQGDHRPVDNN